MRGVSQTHTVLALFLSGEFLLHIPFLLYFSRGGGGVGQGLLYRGVCLTHPMLAFFLNLGSFSYTSRTGFIFYIGSFSYTSHVCLIFLWGVSLTHPILALFLSGEFLLHIPCLLFVWGVSLTHPMLAFFNVGRNSSLHIPCCLYFYLGSFSYTSHADFIFYCGSLSYTSRTGFVSIWGVSLTHPMLALVFCGEFLLHIPC